MKALWEHKKEAKPQIYGIYKRGGKLVCYFLDEQNARETCRMLNDTAKAKERRFVCRRCNLDNHIPYISRWVAARLTIARGFVRR